MLISGGSRASSSATPAAAWPNSAACLLVRNLPDGRVEAVFEGPPEDVRRLVDWAHTGPRLATVNDVAVQPEPPEGLPAFHIR